MEKEVNFRLAVKAFIVNKNKLFATKRAEDDIQMPGAWEIPGGRLELGEDPILGLIREVREETGLYVLPLNPLSVRHFERTDGQLITMLVFLCKPTGGYLKLSNEHTMADWIKINEAKEKLTDFFHKEVDIFSKFRLSRLI